MIRFHVKKKKKKKVWNAYYKTVHRLSQATTDWISMLSTTDQRSIFSELKMYTETTPDYLLGKKTNSYWRRMLKNVQTHLNEFRGPIIIPGVGKTLHIPLLLSFPSGFTVNNIGDIIAWYGKMVNLPHRQLPWNLTGFEEDFIIQSPELKDFQCALKQASRANTFPGNQPHKNHFVFKGHNIFFESQQLLILYDYEFHKRPLVYKQVHPNCRKKLNMDDPILYEIETIVQEGGNNRYQRVLSNGAFVECTPEGKIIFYKKVEKLGKENNN